MKKISCQRLSLIGSLTLVFFIVSLGIALAETPQYGGTLRILYGYAARSMDPHRDVGTGGIYILNQVIESLVGADDEDKIIPGLAVSLPTVSSDGLEYVFELRKGVKFHDGTDFTAEDVKFCFDRVVNPDVSTQANKVGVFIESTTVVDPYKVKVRLKKPWSDFLTLMAHDKVFHIFSPECTKDKDFGVKKIAGTGPFKLVEWNRGTGAELVKNENYWQKGVPYLDKIVFREIEADSTRVLGFQAGEGDVLLTVPHKDVADLQKKKNLKVQKIGSGQWVAVWFNTRKPPFDNKQVRQALSKALDRKAIMDSVYYGLGSPATGFLPAYFKEYYGGKDPYNPDEAKKLLKEAGYSQAKPLKVDLMYRAEEVVQEMATIVQAMWAQVGVTAELRPVQGQGIMQVILGDAPIFSAMCMWLNGGPLKFDHASRMFASDSYQNTPGYNKKDGYQNPRAEELFEKVVGEPDEKKQMQMYKELTNIVFYEDVPVAIIGFPENIDITYDYVKNWHVHMSDYACRKNVWMSKK